MNRPENAHSFRRQTAQAIGPPRKPHCYLRRALTRRIASVSCALSGVAHLVRTQTHAQFHAVATAGVIATGVALRLHADDWRWLIAAMVWVWIAEGLNTAVELLADAVHPPEHPLIGMAKDVAAGVVLIAAIAAAVSGGTVFWQHLAGPQ